MHRSLSFRNAARDPKPSTHSTALRALFVSTLLLASGTGAAETIQIFGPAGSVGFGTQVKVLPNGNVVVTAEGGQPGDRGAVYLYSRSGTLISTLTGSTPGDRVGFFSIVVLSNGNFVISSPSWDNGSVVNAGALTWASGSTGVSGVVSASNSIVGTNTNDGSSFRMPVALSNGNYVIGYGAWDNASIRDAGAVRLCSGASSCVGPMSSANALVGSTAGDFVGDTVALSNGNYVVISTVWDNGAVVNAGASTWGNGSTGTTGVVSTSNSLFGTAFDQQIGRGGAQALANGNYVVSSPNWYPTGLSGVGAVTWVNGSTGRVGAVSAANSLVGSSNWDAVGSAFLSQGRLAVLPLSNGNYVITSPLWDNGVLTNAGAVTWGNGSSGSAGIISAANSLVGSTNELVGWNLDVLNNGHYVTSTPLWNNLAGAVTWGNGNGGTSGPVSAANSLIGGAAQNRVGINGITALTNGNYVVASSEWSNGAIGNVGAATWRSGSAASPGVVSAVNSLIGSTAGDGVANNVVALSNGNYVVSSAGWDGAQINVGATTWANGGSGLVGVVSAGNSWIGSSSNDSISESPPTALSNGQYVLSSSSWDNGAIQNVGAATSVNGSISTSGVLGVSNSLIGNVANDQVSLGNDQVSPGGIINLTDGYYLVLSPNWDNGALADAGAVSLQRGDVPAAATITLGNSVIGTVANGGVKIVLDFNITSATVAVGQPASNLVSVLTLDFVFRDGFQ